ncbi:MAG: Sua5/YciO/YrdC/YwlC family protein [Gammaproteobacteria bacterium]|nr:Sua5/YciO/YrdC/YwlC family protein [Gammaproteobacteria bacterium]
MNSSILANRPPAWRLMRLARIISNQGVIAYPTEGVWGLGCAPWSEAATQRILVLKNRPQHKGLILVAANLEQFADYLQGLSEAQMAQLHSVWPGPVTFLVPDNGKAPPWVRGDHPTVALRVSSHPVIQALCEAIGHPLVSTSANPAMHPPAKNLTQVRRYFGEALDGWCPGELGDASGPSEIRDLLSGEQKRARESAAP